MDFLEHKAVDDVIILSVVLEEVKHKNQSVYQRLRALCASASRRFYVFANEHHRLVARSTLSSPRCSSAVALVCSTFPNQPLCVTKCGQATLRQCLRAHLLLN